MPPPAVSDWNAIKSVENILPKHQPVDADWSAYAKAYDLLSLHNPEYQALLQDFEAFLGGITPPSVIYDIGGGTGNYSEIVSRVCPSSQIKFVEPDIGMINLAHTKLSANEHISFQNTGLEAVTEPNTADLIISIHSLYAMPDPRKRLDDMRRILRPGGTLYLVDLGRYMNVLEWRRYLFSHIKKEKGFFEACRIFWQGREIAKQNKIIFRAQMSGTYWTHTASEIATIVAQAGFEIIEQKLVYRGYSDLLVCRVSSF